MYNAINVIHEIVGATNPPVGISPLCKKPWGSDGDEASLDLNICGKGMIGQNDIGNSIIRDYTEPIQSWVYCVCSKFCICGRLPKYIGGNPIIWNGFQ